MGLLFFARFVLGALAGPWVGVLADRWPRRAVMLSSDVIRCGLLAGMTAVAGTGGNAYAIYVLAIASTVVAVAYNPAQSALLPSLVDSPDQLTAANVVGNTISSVGMFAGPALGGILARISASVLRARMRCGSLEARSVNGRSEDMKGSRSIGSRGHTPKTRRGK